MDAPAEDLEEDDGQGGDEHDGREHDVEDEPSLGSVAAHEDRQSQRLGSRP